MQNDKMMNGMSLFSSAGIAEMYFEKIGINIKYSNEIDPIRSRFFKSLYPKTEVITGDIQKDEIKYNLIEKAKGLDFLIATPPCQGFSTLGVTKKTDNLQFDKRNFLIFDVLEIIEKSDFKYVLIENVPRFLNLFYPINNEFKNIEEILNFALGNKYNIKVDIFDASDYGVPQFRKRAIIRIFKKGLEWGEPQKFEKITLRQSIGHLPSLEAGEKSDIKWHYAKIHNNRDILAMQHTPEGKSALLNAVNYPKKENGDRISGFHNTYKRMRWDEPAKARTTNCGNIGSHNNVHPGNRNDDGTYSDSRVLTLLETFIVSSIPPNTKFPEFASDALIRKMIGEAIPPRLCMEILKPIII